MTATTSVLERVDRRAGGRLRASARFEVLKLTTSMPVRTGLLLACVFVAVLAGLYGTFSGEVPGGIDNREVLLNVYLAGYRYGSFAAVLLGITLVAGEARQGILLPTVLAASHRWHVVAVKCVVAAAAGLVIGALLVGVTLLVGVAFAVAHSSPTRLAEPAVAGAIIRSMLAFVAWTWVGLGLGSVFRRDVVALTVGLVWLLLVDGTLAIVMASSSLTRGAAAYLPQALSTALSGGIAGGSVVTEPWIALAVLLGYGLLLSALGAFALEGRDLRE